MAISLTYEDYLKDITKRINNLKSSLNDYEKIYKLFSEHPELFTEFKRINQIW